MRLHFMIYAVMALAALGLSLYICKRDHFFELPWKERILKAAPVVLSVMVLAIASLAPGHWRKTDFGDYSGDSDWDSGWDSDWDSGWDSDWDSGWDSDDSWDWDSGDSWDWDDDDDHYGYSGYDSYDSSGGSGYSGSGYSGSGYSGSGGSSHISYNPSAGYSFFRLIGLLLLNGSRLLMVIIVLLLITGEFARKNKNQQGRPQARPQQGRPQQGNPSLMSAEEYRRVDRNFDETAFLEQLSKLYVQLQQAWQAKDLSPVRPYLTDAFYAQMDGQLEAKRRAGQTNYVERIAVLETRLEGLRHRADQDHAYAQLYCRIVDYTLEDATGRLVSGDRTKEKFMRYRWELVRKAGVVTQDGNETRSVTCPHCGAPLNMNASAKCEYCGSVITAPAESWALSRIEGLSQRTM